MYLFDYCVVGWSQGREPKHELYFVQDRLLNSPVDFCQVKRKIFRGKPLPVFESRSNPLHTAAPSTKTGQQPFPHATTRQRRAGHPKTLSGCHGQTTPSKRSKGGEHVFVGDLIRTSHKAVRTSLSSPPRGPPPHQYRHHLAHHHHPWAAHSVFDVCGAIPTTWADGYCAKNRTKPLLSPRATVLSRTMPQPKPPPRPPGHARRVYNRGSEWNSATAVSSKTGARFVRRVVVPDFRRWWMLTWNAVDVETTQQAVVFERRFRVWWSGVGVHLRRRPRAFSTAHV